MKYISAICFLLSAFNCMYAQNLNEPWHHKDLDKDSIPGISLRQAYEYLEGRPSKKVVVAIIDSGFELDHETIKNNLWENEDEIAGNGIDDDQNGYVDDLHGWNFIGGLNGNVTLAPEEVTLEYGRLKSRYENTSEGNSKEYKYWKKIEKDYVAKSQKAMEKAEEFLKRYKSVIFEYNLLAGYIRVDTLSVDILEKIESPDSVVQKANERLTRVLGYLGGKASLVEVMEIYTRGYGYYEANYAYNLDFDPWKIVGDDVDDLKNKYYGNTDIGEVGGYAGSHGTHVAGIVGGQSDNSFIGICENVVLMFIRAIPSGWERDKDVANSIIYAVDNGAQIINMSFGKEASPHLDYVRKAVKYAERKGVLMVKSAGNEGSQNAEFPDGTISANRKSKNWISVGASSINYDKMLPARFSNYGQEICDLFAPGKNVLSAIPGNSYETMSGTSMATPVVAGVGALILSYFPDLSALEVKEILMESVTKVNLEVRKPGSEEDLVLFSKLSKSGGIVNAFDAVKLADQRSKIKRK